MPGKREDAGSYAFVSQMRLHRTVAAADTLTQAAIGAIPEVIPLQTDEDDADRDGISIGRWNNLILGILFPAAVTSVTVQTYVNMKGSLNVSNYWALVREDTIARSAHISMHNVFPGECKVVVSAMTGTGSIQIVYSKSA